MTGSVRIKICGVQDVEDALAAVDAGADLIGINFVDREVGVSLFGFDYPEPIAQAKSSAGLCIEHRNQLFQRVGGEVVCIL